LAFYKLMVVAYQLHNRMPRITAIKQPAEFINRIAQAKQWFAAE